MDLLSWWNLLFLLPAVAALLYIVLLATGVVAGDDGAADGDFDVHLDGDFHADLDPGDFHGIEHAVGHAGGEAAGGGSGGLWDVLSLFGVGRAPLSLLLISFFLLWGLFGWIGNSIFSAVFPSPAVFIWPSLILAFVSATGLTRLLANGLHRVMPATETYAISNRQLVGKRAQLRYLASEDGGTAQLYDELGRLHEVPVRVLPGESPIPAQSHVVLWRFDAAQNAFLVTPEDFDGGVLSDRSS